MTMNDETLITVVTWRKFMSDSLNLIPTNRKWFSFADGNSGGGCKSGDREDHEQTTVMPVTILPDEKHVKI
jgi:hypothetical protein